MSMCGFDQHYELRPGAKPIHARPMGNLAAAAIGGAALLVLGVSLFFVKPRPVVEAAAAHGESDASAPASTAASVKQRAAFDLTAPEFAKEKKTFATRRADATGGREDNLTIGEFAFGGPYLRLDIRPAPAEKRAAADFFLDMTRHAAGAGLAVVKISQPSTLGSRFGALETADIRLSTPAAGEGAATERACLALRLAGDKQPVEIAGVVCGAPTKPIDRRALGCILDRLDYLSNGEDAAFDRFFGAAEQGRGGGCSAAGATASANAAKNSWLDAHSAAPPFKTDGLAPKHTKKAR